MLQQARKLAQQTAAEQGEKYKNQYDKLASPHKFETGQKVWLSDTTSIGKNAKLTPNWIGPYEIVDINDTNAKLKIKNKLKVVNIARLKRFVEEATTCSSESDQCLDQDDPGLSQDQQDQSLSRPMTRAFKKLTDLKNAAAMAISLLSKIEAEECYGYIFLKILIKIIAQTVKMAFALFSKCQISNNSCKNFMLVRSAPQKRLTTFFR